MKNNLLVIKHNDLILKAAYKLSLLELRILLFAIAKINPVDKTMPEKHVLDTREMAEIYHIPLHKFWQQITLASETLFKREIKLELSETITKRSRWLYDIEMDSGEKKITFMFHPEVLAQLHDFENKFTSYQLENIVQMGSAYSIRFYEWAILHLKGSKKPVATYRKTVVELKEILELGDKYSQLSDFKKYVLETALQEINKQTDVKFSYHVERSGHTIKYIEFKAKYNNRHKEDEEATQPKPTALPDDLSSDPDYPTNQSFDADMEAIPAHLQADKEPPALDDSLTLLPPTEEYDANNYTPRKQATIEEQPKGKYNKYHKYKAKPHPTVEPLSPRHEGGAAGVPGVDFIPHPPVASLTYAEDMEKYHLQVEELRNKKRGIELEIHRDLATATDPDAITRYIQHRLIPPNKALKVCFPRTYKRIKDTQKMIAEARDKRSYLRKGQKMQI